MISWYILVIDDWIENFQNESQVLITCKIRTKKWSETNFGFKVIELMQTKPFL